MKLYNVIILIETQKRQILTLNAIILPIKNRYSILFQFVHNFTVSQLLKKGNFNLAKLLFSIKYEYSLFGYDDI